MPVYDYSKLRGRIREKCGTQANYAKLIHRTNSFVSSVLNNKSYFEQKDIEHSVKVLEISDDDIGLYFFAKKVHTNETMQKGVAHERNTKN